MQLLTNASEEGKLPRLGWIDGMTYNFKSRIEEKYKIPHIGWNFSNVILTNVFTKGYEGEIRFYFVYSYFVKINNEENSMVKTTYGLEFDSAIVNDNILILSSTQKKVTNSE